MPLLAYLLQGAFLAGVLIGFLPRAEAALIVEWRYAVSSIVVGPTDSFSVAGIITNSPASDESFYGSPIQSATRGSVLDQYDFYYFDDLNIRFPSYSPNLFETLSDVVLRPGESAEFIYHTYVPAGPAVPPGKYSISYAAIESFEPDGSVSRFSFRNGGQFTVHVTPAPAALPLLASGLALAGAFGATWRLWGRQKQAGQDT